eukprot:COSAG02_NODE_1428_length_12662_cov_12.695137_2_plen_46_part_00
MGGGVTVIPPPPVIFTLFVFLLRFHPPFYLADDNVLVQIRRRVVH